MWSVSAPGKLGVVGLALPCLCGQYQPRANWVFWDWPYHAYVVSLSPVQIGCCGTGPTKWSVSAPWPYQTYVVSTSPMRIGCCGTGPAMPMWSVPASCVLGVVGLALPCLCGQYQPHASDV